MNKRGVFWIVDNNLLAFPFDKTATKGVAKSGNTFNHKRCGIASSRAINRLTTIHEEEWIITQKKKQLFI